ncbi:hypothetical protein KIH74_31380 [Kineosporia sp. J2-2]|uniref:Uncharacterized protein n=1 Tax=Kineosporia corallincola TaxID=2835133 RepID=A0ABS5TRR2_9ACTN|nr:hypothetical protein [Kineosporia corallincola]MBT0773491.1 hypothetical protein [Kineosporia corallincola]
MKQVSRRTLLNGGGAALTATAIGAGWVPERAGAASVDSSAATGRGRADDPVLDTVVFAQASSESAHGVSADTSSVVEGALGQGARRLEPSSSSGFWGGTVAFTLAVKPTGTTYLSVKLFGEEYAAAEQEWRLHAFVDGRSLGWLETGAVDNVDLMSQHPRRINGFFLHTLPLPQAITRGRHELRIEIRSTGRIYAYGATDATYFRPMTSASRALYRAYTHTAPYFTPAADDPFGTSPAPGTRASTDDEVLARVRARVLADQNRLLFSAATRTTDAWGWTALAEGYFWEDGPAYHDPRAVAQVCAAIDGRYLAWKNDDAVLTSSDQQWQGFGRVGLALCRLWEVIGGELDRTVTTGITEVANPGFEIGLSGWTASVWSGSGSSVADPAVHRTGAGSAKVAATAGSLAGISVGANRVLVGQGPHRYGVWCRTDDVASPGAYLDVIFYDASGTVVQGDRKQFAATGTHDWEQVTLDLTTPVAATHARLDLRVQGGGTAWFDDVTIEKLDGAADPVPAADLPVRRVAYAQMLLASREYWRQHQRHYTNQVLICAIGVYQANRGLRLLGSDQAWPETRALRWLYEAVGLEPLRGPETEDGTATWPLGHDYHVVTPKGLTRELGYVGTYGEVSDWLVALYESVTVGPDGTQDAVLREQILRIIRTRALFRLPGVDEEGNHVMRLESVIGWRNEHYPGDAVYAQRTAWDGHPLEAVGVFGDPRLAGYAQQMVADGQFAPQIDLLLANTGNRVGLNAFHLISRDLPGFGRLAPSNDRLPMGWDRPDVLFTDETAGVVALKRGREVLYVSLYWRARQAVNNWARVHLVTPQSERSGTIDVTTRFGTARGDTFTVQDWVTTDYAVNDGAGACTSTGGGRTPPGDDIEQAWAGTVLRRRAVPGDMDPALGCGSVTGIESIDVGRAPYYELDYAGYLIAMNTTTDQTFTFDPGRSGRGVDLATGHSVQLSARHRLGPGTSVVLFDPSGRS